MFELPAPDHIREIAAAFNLRANQVGAAIRLLDEGNTIPFIARYRKEMTGELDENQLRSIASQYESDRNLFGRKQDVLRLLAEQGVMADEAAAARLIGDIAAARTLTDVDDIYRPYRPKRRTRASMAKERGLEPLALWLRQAGNRGLDKVQVWAFAAQFVSEDRGVTTEEDALQGAADIIAEEVADDAPTRRWIRMATWRDGVVRSSAVQAAAESVYEAYYDYAERVAKIPPHRVLAMNRGEREGFLRVSISASQDVFVQYLTERCVWTGDVAKNRTNLDSFVGAFLEEAATDAYRRLLAPAIEREIRASLTERAEEHAIHIFGENLSNLLMQPPIRGKTVLGVDPAYRTGCKLAVVDDTGKLLEVGVIYPTPPQSKVEAAQREVLRLLGQYDVELIAIGNGTASRETEAFIAKCVGACQEDTGKAVPYAMVSEAGASVYSASPLAGVEFPELNVAERSAISIARRIQDPLAELVKIDPKAVGVGQYQHDVSQKRLDETLAAVVETAVNRVGVDVNTASASLLSYVAGLNRTVARNMVDFREKNGRYRNRRALAHVPRLGPKTLEQCVGFLRVTDGDEALDATPIHPESYGAVVSLLQRTGSAKSVIRDPRERQEWIRQLRSVSVETLSAETGVGAPTLRDILDALERPGRDVRDNAPAPVLRTNVLKLEELEVGAMLTGTVRNVVDFGAFVDVGLKHDGLVHVSELSDRFVKHPMDVVSVGDIVTVRVLQVDVQKQRLGLSMKTAPAERP